MRKVARSFLRGLQELEKYVLLLKQLCCPSCGAAETLNCNSRLYGNDPDGSEDGRIQRGQRVWCSNRGQRRGCGRSFSIFLAGVLPRLSPEATEQFILAQLDRAGLGHNTFTTDALALIIRSGEGLLRRTRNLCLSALIEAVRDQTRTVDLKQVNRVLIQPHWRRTPNHDAS